MLIAAFYLFPGEYKMKSGSSLPYIFLKGGLIHYLLAGKCNCPRDLCFVLFVDFSIYSIYSWNFAFFFPPSAWVTCASRWVGTAFQNILSKKHQKKKKWVWKQDFILVAKLKENCKQWMNKYSSCNLWSSGATWMNILSILEMLTERTIINSQWALSWCVFPPLPYAQQLFHLLPVSLFPYKITRIPVLGTKIHFS